MYYSGLGVQRDLSQSIDNWCNAAEAGAGMARNAPDSADLNSNETSPIQLKPMPGVVLQPSWGVAVAYSHADMTFAPLNDLQSELAIYETQVLKQSLLHE